MPANGPKRSLDQIAGINDGGIDPVPPTRPDAIFNGDLPTGNQSVIDKIERYISSLQRALTKGVLPEDIALLRARAGHVVAIHSRSPAQLTMVSWPIQP